VKARQLIRRFRQAGVDVIRSRGKGGHLVLRYHDRQTTLPMHGARDIGPDFIRNVCKQLGLDPKRVL
jgi:mRNA interferase HicA